MPHINDFGLEPTKGAEPIASEIKLCEKWLQEFVTPRKTINTSRGSSYSLKHVVERWTGEYVSNGAFIQAAVNLGYEYRQDGPNAFFNMSFPRYRSERFRDAFEKPREGFTNRLDERAHRMSAQAQDKKQKTDADVVGGNG